MRCRDPYGYALTTSPEAAAAYIAGAAGRARGCKSGALPALAASIAHDPTFALGHAALALLGHELCAEVDVEARLRDAPLHAAARHRARAQPRARRGQPRAPATRGRWSPTSRRTPCDALLLSTAVPTIAFAGVTEVPEEAWAIVERAIPAYGDDWWFTGLLAFVRQEQGRFDEAMTLSCASLAVEPGRRALGARPRARALRDRRPRCRAGLDGRVGGRRRRRDRQPQPLLLARRAARAVPGRPRRRPPAVRRASCAPSTGSGCRALVDTGSLLFRWALTPDAADVPGLEQVAALAGRDVLERPATPFLAMHSAVTLLALGRHGPRSRG